MPSVDLFDDTLYLAIFIILYTLFSALCALFTHILFRMNGQQIAYVSLMCVSIFVQQLVTLLQMAVSLARWAPLQRELYLEDLKMWRNPKASIVYLTHPNIVMRVIFATRVYFFNVESLLFFFWSFSLFCSLWEIKWLWIRNPKTLQASKFICFILPALQAIFSNIPPIMVHETIHLILADFIMVTAITLGIILLFLILLKFILVFNTSGSRAFRVRDDRDLRTALKSKSQVNTEDRWIIVRFLVGFCVMGGLQTSFLYSQYAYAQNILKIKAPDSPKPTLGWTKAEQLEDWAYYLAGSSTGYLIFLVFGTTHECRIQMRKILGSLLKFGWPQKSEKEAPLFVQEEKGDDLYSGRSTPAPNQQDSRIPALQTPPPSRSGLSSSYSSTADLLHQPSQIAQAGSQSNIQTAAAPKLHPEYRASTFRSFGTSYEDEYYHENYETLYPTPPPKSGKGGEHGVRY